MKKIIFGLFFLFSGIIFAQKIEVKTVTASSCLSEGGEEYKADYLFDNSEKSWVEGEKGSGKGVTIDIQFADEVYLKEFSIKNGFGKNSLYFENNRVRKMKAEFSGGRSAEIFLEDNPGFQKVVLSTGTYTRFVKLIIEDVYRGTKYDDTAISEISFLPFSEIRHDEMNREIVYKNIDDFFNAWKPYASKKSFILNQRYDSRHHEDTFLLSTDFTCIPVEDGSVYYKTLIMENNLGFEEEDERYGYALFFKWNGNGFEKAQNLIPFADKNLNEISKALSELKSDRKEAKVLLSTIQSVIKAKKENCPYFNKAFDFDIYDDGTLRITFNDDSFIESLSEPIQNELAFISQKYYYHVPCQRITTLQFSARELK